MEEVIIQLAQKKARLVLTHRRDWYTVRDRDADYIKF